MGGRERRVVAILGLLTGAALIVIGVRFFLVPASATKFFGIDPKAMVPALHYVIALRDIWLGALAIAFVALGEWRALALWLGCAVAVCFADAWIAATSSGRWVSVAFHIASGIFCAALARASWRAAPAARP
ncbi:MAG: DUF4267 domain-containing protein [Hyphomicrobiaceae bacterium]